ncbi:7838_t:CDS:1, partial [Dentiscutata heterogama]
MDERRHLKYIEVRYSNEKGLESLDHQNVDIYSINVKAVVENKFENKNTLLEIKDQLRV